MSATAASRKTWTCYGCSCEVDIDYDDDCAFCDLCPALYCSSCVAAGRLIQHGNEVEDKWQCTSPSSHCHVSASAAAASSVVAVSATSNKRKKQSSLIAVKTRVVKTGDVLARLADEGE